MFKWFWTIFSLGAPDRWFIMIWSRGWIRNYGAKKIKRVLDQIGPGYLWTKAHENDIGILNIIKQRLKDIELQRWLSDVNNDVRKDANQKNKLRTFRKFKTIENYKCEDYLRQVTNIRHRITLTKLRLSNHKLAIETGRYVRPYKALSCLVLSCSWTINLLETFITHDTVEPRR